MSLNKSKPIRIPKSKKEFNNLEKYSEYEYKSPNPNLNIKNEEEIFIEKFYYMNDNFDPNKPPKKSPPISKSFKEFYLNNVASKVLIN
uniref:Uncharacterized protein n=1 Tax=viral metagenome TaxID=1070528 RepID=A0A6C0LXD4_9ZZZZ